MDSDRLKRLIIAVLLAVGFWGAGQQISADERRVAVPAPLIITASPQPAATVKHEPRQRRPQFRARLLRQWWQPRINPVAVSRRPTITKII